jgi:hypothetical protein
MNASIRQQRSSPAAIPLALHGSCAQRVFG